MRYIVILTALFFWGQIASAQSNDMEAHARIYLGHGIFLKTIPPKYITVVEDTPDFIKNGSEELIVIPATYETITETVVVQDAYSELRVSPAIIADDGSILQPAVASLVDIPEVTRTVQHRVMKTSPRVIKRIVPYHYTPKTIRKKVSEAIFIFRNQAGEEIRRYENSADALHYIEGLPN